MASYTVDNGDTLTLDTSLNGQTVDSITVNDGVCNVVNDTDDGLVLQMASGGTITVSSFGQFNVRGKMIEIATSDGTRGLSIQHWQTEHPVNIVWVETGESTNIFKPWYCINPGGSTTLDFNMFADDERVGRVFKWSDGAIQFSPNQGEACVPANGARIKVPNIIFSTEAPFTSTVTAKFASGKGGYLSMKNVYFSDFSASLSGFGHIDTEGVGFHGAAYILYCNDFNLVDTHSALKDMYSSSFGLNYSSNGQMRNCSAASAKSFGMSLSYLRNVDVDGIDGYVMKRDGIYDYAVYLNTVTNSNIQNVKSVGGSLALKNTSNSRIRFVECIDHPNMVEDTAVAVPNILIDSSSDNTIRDITIPDGGGAAVAYIKIQNSPGIDIVKADIESSHGNNVIAADVSFGVRYSEINYAGYRGSVPFFMPAKNNGVVMQHITTQNRTELNMDAPNLVIKGADATGVSVGSGAEGSGFAQIYTSDTEGKLVFVAQKNSVESGIFDSIEGTVKFSYDGRVYFNSLGDSAVLKTPYRIKGVTFKDVQPEISGYGTSVLAFDYAIDTGDGFSQFKALTASNLSSENIDPQIGFLMKIRAVAGDISSTTYIESIQLETLDSRYVYPLDFEKGKIVFDELIQLDDGAKYFLYYTDGFGTSAAEMVKDADGVPVYGNVDGRESVEFTYDFLGDDSNGRVPGEPVSMTLVVAGTSLAQNVIVSQVFDAGQVNTFNVRTSKDFAYIGA